MKRYKKSKGLGVVSLAEGALLGKIEDLQFDLETGQVYGFRIKGPGVFAKTGGVAAEAVHRLGRDLLLVQREADVEWAGERRNPEDGRAWASRYLKSRVLTRRGVNLGSVEDFLLGGEPLFVKALLVDGERMVALDQSVALGRDAVVLDDATVLQPLPEEGVEGWWDRVRDAFSSEKVDEEKPK
ncbi:MAG TPA: PRC-barrel domain-containing protein [Myxococcota bacterium]|nr:PRC-barrel domain-containing protein [Myxococcota bacterium]HND30263.1 PRC-barrel domain-containing protein [Myxococcota bacterium]